MTWRRMCDKQGGSAQARAQTRKEKDAQRREGHTGSSGQASRAPTRRRGQRRTTDTDTAREGRQRQKTTDKTHRQEESKEACQLRAHPRSDAGIALTDEKSLNVQNWPRRVPGGPQAHPRRDAAIAEAPPVAYALAIGALFHARLA